MTASTTAERASLRSQRLNQITNEPHTKLDALVKAHAPFETQANFARFVVAQYLFQSELVALYNDPELIKLVPDLAERCRAEAAKLDLADLETEVPAPVAGAVQNPSKAEALGWLFVSEDSKLGAAFLVVVLGGVGQLAGSVMAAFGLGIANKILEPQIGAVLGKILILALIIVFIQKRPQGLFALKGRVID